MTSGSAGDGSSHATRSPPATADPLTSLVTDARRGDRDAFAAIYSARAGAVAKYVGAILRDEHLAEDAVAQTFLHAWRDLPKLRRAERFDAWLFRIAHNRALDELRRAPTIPLDEGMDLPETNRGGSPEAAVEAKLNGDRVRQGLIELPEAQRQVLILRFLQQLPHGEIARRMGKSGPAVRMLQHRALANMRRVLAADG